MKILFRLGALIAIFFTIGFFSSSKAADLLDVIKNEPDLSLFLEAITYGRAELVCKAIETTPTVGVFLPFTVFAPNNEAMKKAGLTSESMKDMATKEGFFETGYDANNPEHRCHSLRGLIKQHVCMKKKLKKTELKGELERFEGKNLTIDGDKIKGKSTVAIIVKPDLDASNGILHIIDTFLD